MLAFRTLALLSALAASCAETCTKQQAEQAKLEHFDTCEEWKAYYAAAGQRIASAVGAATMDRKWEDCMGTNATISAAGHTVSSGKALSGELSSYLKGSLSDELFVSTDLTALHTGEKDWTGSVWEDTMGTNAAISAGGHTVKAGKVLSGKLSSYFKGSLSPELLVSINLEVLHESKDKDNYGEPATVTAFGLKCGSNTYLTRLTNCCSESEIGGERSTRSCIAKKDCAADTAKFRWDETNGDWSYFVPGGKSSYSLFKGICRDAPARLFAVLGGSGVLSKLRILPAEPVATEIGIKCGSNTHLTHLTNYCSESVVDGKGSGRTCITKKGDWVSEGGTAKFRWDETNGDWSYLVPGGKSSYSLFKGICRDAPARLFAVLGGSGVLSKLRILTEEEDWKFKKIGTGATEAKAGAGRCGPDTAPCGEEEAKCWGVCAPNTCGPPRYCMCYPRGYWGEREGWHSGAHCLTSCLNMGKCDAGTCSGNRLVKCTDSGDCDTSRCDADPASFESKLLLGHKAYEGGHREL